MQEKYRDRKKKLYMCFVDSEKAFDRVPRRDAEAEAGSGSGGSGSFFCGSGSAKNLPLPLPHSLFDLKSN